MISEIEIPKVTFGIIVLNGEPFTRYCLRSIYPFAHEIIVVEGGHEDTRSVTTPEGHSTDGTLETLYRFKAEEDPGNKVTIITRDSFWPKKDELGNDRTPQSRAYAEKATGDYLWQIDIDEFYREEDMITILNILKNDSSISAMSFKQQSFWGGIDYISESYYLRNNKGGWHRIFKWANGYKYLTHEPPTVLDGMGNDLHQKHWIKGEEMEKKNIFFYHYCLLFPLQVEQKVKIYKDEKPDKFSGMVDWAEQNFFKMTDPFRVHNVYKYPSWLKRFKGKHPEQILSMMSDIREGKIKVQLRRTDDIEKVLGSNKYLFNILILKFKEPFERMPRLSRIKNIPRRIRKIYKKWLQSQTDTGLKKSNYNLLDK